MNNILFLQRIQGNYLLSKRYINIFTCCPCLLHYLANTTILVSCVSYFSPWTKTRRCSVSVPALMRAEVREFHRMENKIVRLNVPVNPATPRASTSVASVHEYVIVMGGWSALAVTVRTYKHHNRLSHVHAPRSNATVLRLELQYLASLPSSTTASVWAIAVVRSHGFASALPK